MTDTVWTDEKVDELKGYRESELSAAQIGLRMCISRSAVLGKIKRLGWASKGVSRPRLSDAEREQSRKRAQDRGVIQNRIRRQERRGEHKMEDTPATSRPAFIGSLNVPFADLRPLLNHASNQCRFIAAETPRPDYLACGNETLPGESYCGHHHGVVYQGHNYRPNLSEDEINRRRGNGYAMARAKWGALIKEGGSDSAEASL
jgi:GcrA cell cycle regulator